MSRSRDSHCSVALAARSLGCVGPSPAGAAEELNLFAWSEYVPQ